MQYSGCQQDSLEIVVIVWHGPFKHQEVETGP
jgi:hypothetical protein